jgi:DNA-binding NarL/FixJ family response regulator
LSEGTVKVHLTAIFKALGVASRTQAMVVIARRGIRL